MPAIVVDPELIARLTRDFQLRGTLKPFNLTEDIVPIIDLGPLLTTPTPTEVVTPDLATMVAAGLSAAARHYAGAEPDSTALNVQGTALNPSAGDIVGDTGQLAAGQHFCVATFTVDASSALVQLEHRNAANNALIDSWAFQVDPGQTVIMRPTLTFATNERLRWNTVIGFTGNAAANVMAVPSALDIAV